ncbi:MAG: GAF domain-containing protein, partial [Acidobacteria bacterium]|nr:GAF domain-containing protein [Acidobacteriota bacterium]
QEDYESEFRLVNPNSGEIVWVRGQGVLVGNAQYSPQRLVGITQNISERKHSEILLDTQKQALEMVVGGSPLADVLKYLALIAEHQSAGSSIASILLLDEQERLHNGASPSLPEDYVQALEGIMADEGVGTCSVAAATCETIISPDLAADPKWQDLKHLPLALGLQSAWSLPIVAADKRVLGTFGTYFREKREPTKLERQTVEILAKTAALAIERKQAEEDLRSSEAKLQKSYEELERRVGERTVALSEMNSILQEEVRERRRIEGERVELLRRIVFAQEDERRRIAREMHDQFGQQLTVLKMKLDKLHEDCREQTSLCEQLEALQAIAVQLDDDVDYLAWEMRPTALDDLGLLAALSSYVQNWSKHFGVPVQLHTSRMDNDRLTPEIETALFRIAQEALNNVAKHAEARLVAVVLERRAQHVSLIIEDNGVGFDSQQGFNDADRGLGLLGMRERAALVNGTVEIESQPGLGATVLVRIPAPSAPSTGGTDE